MLYNSVIQGESRIFLLHEGKHISLQLNHVHRFTTSKQVARYKKIVDGYTKYSQKHSSIFQDYGICKFSELILNIRSYQKFIMQGKTNMSLSKMISLRSAGFIESSYTLYHVQCNHSRFILTITWYIKFITGLHQHFSESELYPKRRNFSELNLLLI